MEILKCGTKTLQYSAMAVAIIDTVCTSILLICFVLGSSMMLAFEIIGKSHNATRVLDIVTDNVFGTVQSSYSNVREKKDVAEDMGVWLIIMFLTIVDFVISCIFLDGVKSRNVHKCQIWFNIRPIIIVVFKIVVLINIIYGTSWVAAIPDMIFTTYRIFGLYIGYNFLLELRSQVVESDPMKNLPIFEISGSRVNSFSSCPPSPAVSPRICGGSNESSDRKTFGPSTYQQEGGPGVGIVASFPDKSTNNGLLTLDYKPKKTFTVTNSLTTLADLESVKEPAPLYPGLESESSTTKEEMRV